MLRFWFEINIFPLPEALGKGNDLPISINNQTGSKIYLFKDIKNKIGINKGYNSNSHPLFFEDSRQLKRYKVGVFRYGAPTISLLNTNKQEIFKYACNVYECPYSQSVKFIPISNVVIPQFSLFGCGDFGSGCVPTVIPKAKYLVMLNFSTESLKKIKDIKVEYQKPTSY